jgi:hypothetical protein
MIALDGSWPRNVAILRRIAVQTVVATVASVFLTSIMTVLLVGFDPSRTFSAADLWRTGLSISTIAPALICPLIAFRMSNLMQDLRETHDELANLARKDTLTGLCGGPICASSWSGAMSITMLAAASTRKRR